MPNPDPPRISDRKLAEYERFASRLAAVAARTILPRFRAPLAVQNKAGAGGYDPVTAADRGAESAMRREIERVYPRHGILGEEHGTKRGADPLIWVLDPIDGTRAFIIGQLHWGVLIALSDAMHPILGLMHQPFTGETFTGSRRGARWRRGAKRHTLVTRRCARLEDAIVTATDPAMFIDGAERDAFRAVARAARMRRYGGDCYAYCLLAAGFIDLVIEAGLKPYDIQPLIPIIEAAGGIVTTWSGKDAAQGGQCIAAGDRATHRAALKILSRAANDA